MSHRPNDEPTALYRLYDAAGHLLYVGITDNPRERWTLHANDKPWWHEVVRKEVTWFGTRVEAGITELRAIDTEGPRYDRSNPKNRISDEERRAQDKAYIETALQMIRNDIESGAFPRATALPREKDLASRYALSRSAVSGALWKIEPRLLIRVGSCWLVLDHSSPAAETARSYGAVYGLGAELFGLHVPFHKDDLTTQTRLPKSTVARGLGELQQARMAEMRWGKRGRALWTLLPRPLPTGLRPARDLPLHEDL